LLEFNSFLTSKDHDLQPFVDRLSATGYFHTDILNNLKTYTLESRAQYNIFTASVFYKYQTSGERYTLSGIFNYILELRNANKNNQAKIKWFIDNYPDDNKFTNLPLARQLELLHEQHKKINIDIPVKLLLTGGAEPPTPPNKDENNGIPSSNIAPPTRLLDRHAEEIYRFLLNSGLKLNVETQIAYFEKHVDLKDHSKNRYQYLIQLITETKRKRNEIFESVKHLYKDLADFDKKFSEIFTKEISSRETQHIVPLREIKSLFIPILDPEGTVGDAIDQAKAKH